MILQIVKSNLTIIQFAKNIFEIFYYTIFCNILVTFILKKIHHQFQLANTDNLRSKDLIDTPQI